MRRFALALVGILALLFPAISALPAQAYTNGTICLANQADEKIVVHSSDGRDITLGRSQCATGIPMEGTRVDVDATGSNSYGVDVNSYQLIYNGSRHACHNGETNSSDPPNISTGVVYDTWRSYYCPLPHP